MDVIRVVFVVLVEMVVDGILDVLGDYLTAMTGVFSYGGRRPSQNVYLG